LKSDGYVLAKKCRRLALPPQYQGSWACPEHSCMRRKPNMEMMAGPITTLNECFNEQTKEVVPLHAYGSANLHGYSSLHEHEDHLKTINWKQNPSHCGSRRLVLPPGHEDHLLCPPKFC
jgi:hypothetical protein